MGNDGLLDMPVAAFGLDADVRDLHAAARRDIHADDLNRAKSVVIEANGALTVVSSSIAPSTLAFMADAGHIEALQTFPARMAKSSSLDLRQA